MPSLMFSHPQKPASSKGGRRWCVAAPPPRLATSFPHDSTLFQRCPCDNSIVCMWLCAAVSAAAKLASSASTTYFSADSASAHTPPRSALRRCAADPAPNPHRCRRFLLRLGSSVLTLAARAVPMMGEMGVCDPCTAVGS
jgi:hypothetical protein